MRNNTIKVHAVRPHTSLSSSSGAKIEWCVSALNGRPCMAPAGGHSSISQLNDDHRFHGSQKVYIRRKAMHWHLQQARVHGRKGASQKLSLDILCSWLSEWCGIWGTEESMIRLLKVHTNTAVGSQPIVEYLYHRNTVLPCTMRMAAEK